MEQPVDYKSREIPTSGITIEFSFSTSLTFEETVDQASQQPTFKRFGTGKKAIYQVTYNKDKILDAVELAEFLKGWRRRWAYVDGEKVAWEKIFNFTWCYKKKHLCYRPNAYCFGYDAPEWLFNIWGCLQAELPFSRGSSCFRWGEVIKGTSCWKFDKGRIRHELEKKLFLYRFCPALDFAHIKNALIAFPDNVDPENDNDWQYELAWPDDTFFSIATIATPSRRIRKVKVRGVNPVGYGAVRKIAEKLPLRLPYIPTAGR